MKGLAKIALGLPILFAGTALATNPVFVRLAEGFTSKGTEVGIEAEQRMFCVPTFPGICAGLQPAARLVVVAPKPLQLVKGRWFTYNRLVVLGVDGFGRILPPVPIAIEVEDVTPAMLNLRSDMTADPDGRVLAIRKGRFRFRFRTLCEGERAVTIVKAEVLEQ